MNILSMLARLETALGRNDLTRQMVLLPQSRSHNRSVHADTNLVVAYNGSPRSQTALDLTLWIAHQTRLATNKQVTVQVVYVSNLEDECGRRAAQTARKSKATIASSTIQSFNHTLQPTGIAVADLPTPTASCQLEQFDHADRVLWQARNLADEWRGSLKTHLRFGQVAQELRQVVQAESAALLVVGCETVKHSIVHQLGATFPCPVLGIPPTLEVPE